MNVETEVLKNINLYQDKIIRMAIEFGPRLLLAILVLFIGISMIKSLIRLLGTVFARRKLDPTLAPFILNMVNWILRVLLIVSVASTIGVETTSFVALIGAGGLAIGLALQGSLANFAGGVLILVFRPFVKGDYIQAQGHEGHVQSIDIFATHINTLDNKRIILPNGPLAGSTINNFTAQPTRRVDLSIGISYNADPRTAIKILTDMCRNHPDVLKDPEPWVKVWQYGDNSINLVIRAWTNTENYWPVFFDLNEQIKYTLDENQISIPFPQRDIHIISQSKDLSNNSRPL